MVHRSDRRRSQEILASHLQRIARAGKLSIQWQPAVA